MGWPARLWRTLSRWGTRPPEADLDEELRLHLDLEAEQNLTAGMTHEEAARRAHVRRGNRPLICENARAVWRWVWLDDLRRDLRIGTRMLGKAPGFAAVAILTLALGIGATTAIFSVVNGVLLKPLPFEDPDELVSVWNYSYGASLNPSQYFTYRDENRAFEDIGFWNDNRQVSVTGREEPEQVRALDVTAGLLPLLRVQPLLGRRFTEEDGSPGAGPPVLR